MLCSFATTLSDEQLQEIAALEKELGTTLLAFACLPLSPDSLSQDELERVKALESRFGMSLVAVKQAAA